MFPWERKSPQDITQAIADAILNSNDNDPQPASRQITPAAPEKNVNFLQSDHPFAKLLRGELKVGVDQQPSPKPEVQAPAAPWLQAAQPTADAGNFLESDHPLAHLFRGDTSVFQPEAQPRTRSILEETVLGRLIGLNKPQAPPDGGQAAQGPVDSPTPDVAFQDTALGKIFSGGRARTQQAPEAVAAAPVRARFPWDPPLAQTSSSDGSMTVPVTDRIPQVPGGAVQPGAPPVPKETKGQKLVKVLKTGLVGLAAGGGARTFGEGFGAGFQGAEVLPFVRAQRQQQLQHGNIENQLAQTEVNQRNAQTQLTNAQVANLSLFGPHQEAAQAALNHLQQVWQSGSVSEDQFKKLAQAQTALLHPIARSIVQQTLPLITQIPQTPPRFTSASGTIEPITYRGQVYGLDPSDNEPPEITAARSAATSSLQKSQLAKLDPIIRGQLGEPPTDPAALRDYMQKAEKIRINEQAAPKVIVQNASNPFAGAQFPVATGDDALKSLKPQQAALVKKVANYEINPNSVVSSRSPGKAQLLGLVSQYDPSYDETQYGVKSALRKNFTSGDYSKQINAFNTAVHHLDALSQATDALNNGNTQLFNKIKNEWATATGNPAPTNYQAFKSAVAGELSKVFKGGIASDPEIAEQNKNLNIDMAPAQSKGAIQSYVTLMNGKLKALQNTYEQGMGKPANFRIISPEAEKIFNRLSGQGGPQGGSVRIQASDGSVHDIPQQNLAAAKQRDPNLKVVQ